ncbi:MAG: hypothetical protein IPK15_16220 [Verrucomicrobia bacterium]|nr:hypothetical protein [Verrucomicrobiota bacterium]
MKSTFSALTAALLVTGSALAAEQSPAPARKTNEIKPEAMELLRRVIAEQQRNPDKIIRMPTPTNAVAGRLTKADLEKQYLAGQLTAKQYQKALDQLEKDEQKRAAELEKQRKRDAQLAAKTNSQAAAKSAITAARTNSAKPVITATTNAPVELTPEQKKLADVEARIDAMMRQKAEREKAAAASATNNAAKAPQTKRERLNALLKQMIDGKISETEYSSQRSKILAEPE